MPDVTPLSEREKEILTLVASGMTNREIAQDLSISPNTVKVHLSNIFEKIGVASRTEATVYAIEHRIVDVPGGEAISGQEKPKFWHQPKGVWVAVVLLIGVILFFVLSKVYPFASPATTQPTADLSEIWQKLAPLPEPRQGMAVVVYGDGLYVIAGESSTSVSDAVYYYSPESDTWGPITPKPTAVTNVQGVLIGEKIYIPGGSDIRGEPVSTFEIFDPRREIWESGVDLPQAISDYGLAAFEGRLYLFGGWDGVKALDSVWVYDPGTNLWSPATPMGAPRIGTRAIALSDRIVVIGGKTDEGEVQSEAWAYFPSRDSSGESPWEEFTNLPEGRAGFGAASINDSIYIFGGELSGNGESGLFINGNVWMALPTQEIFAGNNTEVVALNTLLYVVHSSIDNELTELWAYHAFYFSIYLPFAP